MRLIAIALVLLCIAGCKSLSVTSEYGIDLTPNAHGHYVPTYTSKLTIRN